MKNFAFFKKQKTKSIIQLGPKEICNYCSQKNKEIHENEYRHWEEVSKGATVLDRNGKVLI